MLSLSTIIADYIIPQLIVIPLPLSFTCSISLEVKTPVHSIFHFFNNCFFSLFPFFLQVPEYDVASPYLSNNQGDFVSYFLHHSSPRRERDADRYAENSYYKLDIFGTKLHLRLRRNEHLLAPDLKLVRQNGDGRTTSHPAPPNTFYLGHVVADSSSTVALSNHGGLVSNYSSSLKRSYY